LQIILELAFIFIK